MFRQLQGYALKESDWYFYLMDPVDELVYVFYKPNGGTTRQRCHLKYLIDRNGNTLTYTGASGTQQMYYTKTVEWSSLKVTSRTSWRLFSMDQWTRLSEWSRSGKAC
ncbi:MAG: hypothetical protein AAB067_03620 [Planctomycetota bacterium]